MTERRAEALDLLNRAVTQTEAEAKSNQHESHALNRGGKGTVLSPPSRRETSAPNTKETFDEQSV
jgi:hypothetical protein